MKSGITPVVATILLVSIAVIAGISVWFWVSPYTVKPAMPAETAASYVVVSTYPNVQSGGCDSVDIKNNGASQLTGIALSVRNYSTGSQVEYDSQPVFINITLLGPGETKHFNFSSLSDPTTPFLIQSGTYLLRQYAVSALNVPDRIITCTSMVEPVLTSWLSVAYQSPAALSSQSVSRYSLINITFNATCNQASCANVSAAIRYNGSAVSPNTNLSGTVGSTPFYAYSIYCPYEITANLTGYWKFDETLGQIAYDFSTRRNNGTLGNSLNVDTYDPAWIQGKYGDALSFVTNDYVNVGNDSSLVINYTTVSAWIKKNGIAESEVIFVKKAKSDCGYFAYALTLNTVGRINAKVMQSITPSFVWISGNTSVVDNVWHHLAFTFGSDYKIRIYMDGKLDNISSAGTGPIYYFLPNRTAYIGVGGCQSPPDDALQDDYWEAYFDGYIDDVRVYNYALSDMEILSLNSSRLNPVACGPMSSGQTCQLIWTVNATGTASTQYWLDVNFTSSGGSKKDSSDFQLNIT